MTDVSMPDIGSPPVRFDRFVEDALYGADGFYSRAGRAGELDGDFTTSVETSDLFGACVATYLDDVWDDLGRPDPFVVVEAGSGPGKLCSDVFRAVERCGDALRYVMVERSDRQRGDAFARVVAECFPGLNEVPVATAPDLPSGPLTGVVLANELLDNLAPRLLERTSEGWAEIHVADGRPILLPAEPGAARMADSLAPDATPGSRVPLQLKAAVWVRRSLDLLDRGRVLLFDYGVRNTADLAERGMSDWLRTYRRHRRGGSPFEDPGLQDVTCEVAFDQLPSGAEIVEQAGWLRSHGLDEMTAAARARWAGAVGSPTAADVAARRHIDEAAELTDPRRFGSFLVAEWSVGD
jgi:NADH dehydrogenase [ubiquinone] 1 alpha subcomplex assembly factor 7